MMRRAVLQALAGAPFMRGDGLRRPLNAPSPQQVPVGVQPGTSNVVVIANQVIVFGPTGTPVGVFVYAPGTTPGPGNKPVLWMTENFADPFGNVLPVNGIVSFFAGSGAYTKLLSGQINLFNGSDFNPSLLDGSAAGTLSFFSPQETNVDAPAIVKLLSKAANGGTFPLLDVLSGTSIKIESTGTITSTGGTAANPSLVRTDILNTASLINGFTGTLNYRLEADGSVLLYGSVTTPAAGFNFVNINSAPAAAYGALQSPAINPPVLCYDNNAGSIVLAKVFGNGQIQFVNAVASHLVVFNGRYPAS